MKQLAVILDIWQINLLRDKLGKIVCVSGGFDPIHFGHITHFQCAKKLGDTLIVIVNGDEFLKKKKGKAFMSLNDRCNIISAIISVDYIIPFEIVDDMTVIEALKIIKPHIFAKGGDRNCQENIPEWEICQQLNISIMTGVDVVKYRNSSSNYLARWRTNE